MPTMMTQVKFTLEAGIVSAFKARCAAEGASMASVIRHWMTIGQPTKAAKMKTSTRPLRRKAVSEVICVLEKVLQEEEEYRDAIPEVFQTRRDTADLACEELEEAINCLITAF